MKYKQEIVVECCILVVGIVIGFVMSAIGIIN